MSDERRQGTLRFLVFIVGTMHLIFRSGSTLSVRKNDYALFDNLLDCFPFVQHRRESVICEDVWSNLLEYPSGR